MLLWRKGSTEGAPAIDVARLDSVLRPAARFLRLEAKLDPPEGWIDLAAEWPSPATVTRAAGELFRQGRHEDVVRLTESLELPQDTQQPDMVRFVLWVRALAFRALGRDAEVLATLARARALPGDAQGREAMRGLAMSVLARQPVDGGLLERFSGGAGLDSAWLELARRAMAAGNLGTARQAAQRLQQVPDARWRAEGLALAGEIGWVAGEVRTTQSAFDQLFSPGWRASERESRDLAAIQLAHAMVLVEAESGNVIPLWDEKPAADYCCPRIVFSPDGRWLAYTEPVYRSPSPGGAIYHVDLAPPSPNRSWRRTWRPAGSSRSPSSVRSARESR